ncbi:MAG: hypothetical protein ACP5D7_13995 [Limnospira sp.]
MFEHIYLRNRRDRDPTGGEPDPPRLPSRQTQPPQDLIPRCPSPHIPSVSESSYTQSEAS